MAMTIGIVVVACLAAKAAGVPWVMIMSTLRRTKVRGEAGKPLVIALGPPILDPNVLPFDVSVVSKS